jgi:hypothetical protein
MKFRVEFVEKVLRRCPFGRLAGKMDAHAAACLNVTFKAPFYVASRNAQPVADFGGTRASRFLRPPASAENLYYRPRISCERPELAVV